MRRLRIFANRAATALLVGAAVALTGCPGSERDLLRSARATNSIEGYEKVLASNPAEPERSQAMEELAKLKLTALGPQPPASEVQALLERFGETSSKPALERAVAEAEYRDILQQTREDPEKMFAALRPWMERRAQAAPDLARAATRELNAAILDRLNRRAVSPETAARMLRVVQPPDDQIDYFSRLLDSLSRVPADRLLMTVAVGFNPPWMTPTAQALWRQRTREMFAQSLTENSPSTLLLAYLQAFETNPPTREWENARRLYDEALIRSVLASPNRAAVESYLADPRVSRMKQEWTAELEKLDRALSADSASILERFISLNPEHMLLDEAQRQLARRRERDEFQIEMGRILSQTGRVDKPVPVVYAPSPSALPPSLYERAIIVVSLGGRSLATLAMGRTGLLLGRDRDLAQTGRAEGSALLPNQTKVSASLVASDRETGLVLFKLRAEAAVLKDQLPEVKLMDSRLARRNAETTVSGIFSNASQVVRGSGRISATGDELPGSTKRQTLHIWLEKPLSFDSGFIFNDKGEAVGVLAEQKNPREFVALGLAIAAPLIERYYDSLLSDIDGVGPERPALLP